MDDYQSRYDWHKPLVGRTVTAVCLDMAEQHFVSLALNGGEVLTLVAEGD
jgi:hypothetical protein